jgi:DNA modification methylase
VVPVLVLDVTEEEAEKLLLTLDPLTGLATADPGPLRDLLSRAAFSHEDLRRLLGELSASAGPATGVTDPDAIPPAPASPRTRSGDLWVLGEHRLLCGDARSKEAMSRLMGRGRARMCFADPPYGVSYVGKTNRAMRLRGDEPEGLPDLLRCSFAAADSVLAPGAAIYVAHPAGPGSVAFTEAFLGAGWRLRQTLVWMKDSLVLGHADYHYRHEPILYGNRPGPGRWGRGASGWYGGNAETSVLEIPRPKASRDHPTAKPVELLRGLVQNSSAPEDMVLDPFLGSGSTLIACEQLGRRGRFVELDPAYVDVAVARWEAFSGNTATRKRRKSR